MIMEEKMTNIMDSGETTLLIFIDFTKALDSVSLVTYELHSFLLSNPFSKAEHSPCR